MANRKPTLQEIVNAAREQGARDVYTMIPAKVVKWSSSKADCQILIKNVTFGEDESREAVSWPVVPAVPVMFFGAGGFRFTCPISDGTSSDATTGMLLFSHRSMDKWLSGSGSEVDPEFDHDHALTDAVFIPGLRPFGSTWQRVATDGMSIGSDTGDAEIKITSSLIELGGDSATDFMVLGTTFKNALTTLITALNTLTNALVPTTGVTPGAPATFTTAVSTFLATNYLSTLSKTK